MMETLFTVCRLGNGYVLLAEDLSWGFTEESRFAAATSLALEIIVQLGLQGDRYSKERAYLLIGPGDKAVEREECEHPFASFFGGDWRCPCGQRFRPADE